MKSMPLISVIIISYNNFKFLPDSIASVLKQDYKNIELIVSDDCSYGFEVNKIKKMLVKGLKIKKNVELDAISDNDLFGNNISKVVINENEKNMGTVKHLTKLIQMSHGKYVMFLAADDVLHNKFVVSKMVEHFEGLPEDAYILTSQCGMYNYNLSELLYFAVNDELKEKICNCTPQQLYNELSDWCIVPAAGTIYKKCVFDIYGEFDQQYHLIEDWSFFLKASRLGIKIYYYDLLTYEHRDGGISHGNVNGSSRAWNYYLNDTTLLMENEIIPNISLLDKEHKSAFYKKYRAHKRDMTFKFEFYKMSKIGKIRFLLKNCPYYGGKVFSKILSKLNDKAKMVFASGFIMLILYFLMNINEGLTTFSLRYVALGFGTLGLVLFLSSIFIKILWYMVKTTKAIIRVIK